MRFSKSYPSSEIWIFQLVEHTEQNVTLRYARWEGVARVNVNRNATPRRPLDVTIDTTHLSPTYTSVSVHLSATSSNRQREYSAPLPIHPFLATT